MRTYQDLTALGDNEQKRMEFIGQMINEHRSSAAYRKAQEAFQYYEGENPTIARYEKILYDMQGRAHKDMYTANHKIASPFFQIAVDQENMYLLGNGVTFQNEDTPGKLGEDFDARLQAAGEYALICGVSFGFWNLDHLEVFSLTEFAPLYDEENGALAAGVRFWQVADSKPLRATLYELDGYTDYIRRPNKQMEVLHEKRTYQLRVRETPADGMEIYAGDNYPSFPIVPLKNGRTCKSELSGRRNTIDALDLVTSNMVNNVDEGNLIYWVLTNCGGMDDLDDAKFIERLKTTHVAHADGDAGATVESHTIEASFDGTQNAIDTLTKRLYTDFRAFDSSAVSAGNQTATAIKACYVPLDLKADKFERQVTEFILGVLAVAGIQDKPAYTRNKIVNTKEETETVLLGAEYYDGEYITRKLLTILGDGDMADAILTRRAAEGLSRIVPQVVTPNAEV